MKINNLEILYNKKSKSYSLNYNGNNFLVLYPDKDFIIYRDKDKNCWLDHKVNLGDK